MNPLFSLLAASVFTAPLALQPPETGGKRKELVKVTLAPRDSYVKPGDTVQIGVVLDVAKHWHVYWPGQNDSGGIITNVELSFPADGGFTVGAPSFPLPKRQVLPGDIVDYVLEGEVVITIPVKVPATAALGRRVRIAAKVNYLVCNEACIPGDADVNTVIVIADKTEGKESNAKTVDDARAAQPKPQAEGFDAAATAKWEVGLASDAEKPGQARTLIITAKDPAVTKMTFYPADGAAKLLEPVKNGQAKGNTLRLPFEAGAKPVEGVVEITTGNTGKSWTFRMAAPSTPAGATPAPVATPPATPNPTPPSSPVR
jgi:thiol:disulfide interchange protein DsbD